MFIFIASCSFKESANGSKQTLRMRIDLDIKQNQKYEYVICNVESIAEYYGIGQVMMKLNIAW